MEHSFKLMIRGVYVSFPCNGSHFQKIYISTTSSMIIVRICFMLGGGVGGEIKFENFPFCDKGNHNNKKKNELVMRRNRTKTISLSIHLENFGRPLAFLLPKILNIWLSNLMIMSLPDDGYSRNPPCALNLTTTFLLDKCKD